MLTYVEDSRQVKFVSHNQQTQIQEPYHPVNQKQFLFIVGPLNGVQSLLIKISHHYAVKKLFIGANDLPISISLLLLTHDLPHPLMIVIYLLFSLKKTHEILINAKERAPFRSQITRAARWLLVSVEILVVSSHRTQYTAITLRSTTIGH